MQVIRAGEAGRDIRIEMSKIFTDGFYQWLEFFSKDKDKLYRTFAHMFNLDVFFVVVMNDEIAAIAACTNNHQPSVTLDVRELRKHLGFIMGSIAYVVLRNQFEKKQYPFPFTDRMGAIEFVATSEKYRGQGAATKLLSEMMQSTPYSEYVLEAADTNESAIKLYEKLGFAEFMRIPHKHSKRSGVNELVYMKRVK